MPQYVPTQPQSGALYQRLNALIAMNHSGLGANNVGSNPYRPLVGLSFQKPISGSRTVAPPIYDRSSW
jgi:hypothetical protein